MSQVPYLIIIFFVNSLLFYFRNIFLNICFSLGLWRLLWARHVIKCRAAAWGENSDLRGEGSWVRGGISLSCWNIVFEVETPLALVPKERVEMETGLGWLCGGGRSFCFPGDLSLSSIHLLMQRPPLDFSLMDFTSCFEMLLQTGEQTLQGSQSLWEEATE